MSTQPTHLDNEYDRAVELYAVEYGITKRQVIQSALDNVEIFKNYKNRAKKLLEANS